MNEISAWGHMRSSLVNILSKFSSGCQLIRLSCLTGLLLTAGCATLPGSMPVQDGESDRVRQEFKVMLSAQRQCPSAVDADVSVTVDNLLWSGTLSGYLRAMAPAYLRFEGVNPLGLTEAILAVDGESFTYVSVRDQQVYSGPLAAEKISRFAPDGLATAMSYYWLLGRIQPGSLGIAEVGLDQNGQGYWLDLHYAAGKRAMILFDPSQRLVRRHLVLAEDESIAVELSYEYPPQGRAEQSQSASPEDECPLPTRITITKQGNGLISLGFTKRYPTPTLDSTPFRISPPPEYKRIMVQ